MTLADTRIFDYVVNIYVNCWFSTLKVITSAKEVKYYRVFACLSVCFMISWI